MPSQAISSFSTCRPLYRSGRRDQECHAACASSFTTFRRVRSLYLPTAQVPVGPWTVTDESPRVCIGRRCPQAAALREHRL